ncbi:NAD(P)-dependent oxidoreductase [Woeseia oceani]|uniref:NAD(P)-dependent oxidoreductase n=1 Tax=Woeseia oceani TaxID=1548547 RepID=UPI0018D36302|nr:NAD(P)-dependent oxidoreductase [Woeseia oceani]
MSELPRIGFVGTGLMGAPMVRRLLQAAYPVTIWNRTESKSHELQQDGARIAGSPAEVAESADIMCLCVTDTAAVETVVFGDYGVARGAQPDKILVDFSSIKPDATRKMATRLHALSAMHWVDAPVSGGVKGATDGSLIIMFGSEESVVERVTPMFAVLASRATHMGRSGSGQATKLCNQIIVATNLLAIAESLRLGQEAGIRIGRLPAALSGGWADSLPLQIIGPHIAGMKSEKKTGALSTMLKDIESALSAAEDHGVELRVLREAVATYKEACSTAGSDADISELGTFYGIKKSE